MGTGKIVAGCLAPHPPHLVYGENPPQNEPKSECGWENLRWSYERLRESLSEIDYDVLLVQSPHWRTQIATHFLGCENFKSKSVDPIFPHLFRFNYDMNVDVELAQSIHDKAKSKGMLTKMMKNPDFRVDYGTITSLHMTNPAWDKPVVGISSVGRAAYFSMDVMQEEMIKLGEATKEAIEASGKKCVLLASHSLSHRHFITEPDVPEDMSAEHIYHHGQYLWDMKMINLMKEGKSQVIMDLLTDFTEQTISECDGGGLMWMLSAMGMPTTPAKVHGYGTVIGTGNVVAEWRA
ncbi:MAG: tRNA U-34 5-methylaminomethyl-2-thiouridine biosynthesis protein [Bdellovibrionales bacterium]|nr:tRNA U-34 5-methylaminomethyl-2-thiouridine biosynthesis protein [Bdellovibrionales bacterium]NQZ18192.1 tRNA U-34 5-methylaminomethyl-2-thiouridine biosynthesis protein [Bdellovibrionales bacterium]